MAHLRIKGPAGRSEVPLHELARWVGRDRDGDIVLDGNGVSRQHCVIEPCAGGWQVRDLGSRNGTLIRGERIECRRLADGDRIVCGVFELKFVDETAPAAVTPQGGSGAAVADDAALEGLPRAKAPRVQPRGIPLGWLLGGGAAALLAVAAAVVVMVLGGRGGSDADARAASEEWFLMRASGAKSEGPMPAYAIRRGYRWGEISDEAMCVKVGASEWKKVGETELGQGYGPDEPQTADEVPMDADPLVLMQHWFDFQRFGKLVESRRLEVSLIDIDATIPSALGSTEIAKARIRRIVRTAVDAVEVQLRLVSMTDAAKAAGMLSKSASDLAAERIVGKSVVEVTRSPTVAWFRAGSEEFRFLKTASGWKIDVLYLFRDKDTGELEPMAIAMLGAATVAAETDEERVLEIAGGVSQDTLERLEPYLMRGCFADADAVFAAFSKATEAALLYESAKLKAGPVEAAAFRELVGTAEKVFDDACASSGRK